MTTWLLVHSPLLGPASWSAVAAELWDAGHAVLVPDLRPALSAKGHYAVRQATLAAEAVPATARVVVAAHSGAGPLLPVVVDALAARGIAVDRCVFVDAGLPHPGRSRRATLPDELAALLDELAEGDELPSWPNWWPADALAELLPDPRLRAELAADAPRLPADLFDEPLPAGAPLPPSSYLQLSAAYADAAAEAAAAGWPVVHLYADHLALLTRPFEVARLLREAACSPTGAH